MLDFSDHLKEATALLHSNSKENKSLGYFSLLQFQEQAGKDGSRTQILADRSQSLVSTILADISIDDEEIAAQALKCLGFMIYHPAIVASIPVDNVNMVLDGLAKVVVATRVKSVCNLCVWCISMQQFDASILAAHFHQLLRAVVHALDNPNASLSTTFEAVQAVIKLVDQLSAEMRDSSHIWAPPIYRRLVSVERRERSIALMSLVKTKSVLLPPSDALSKGVVSDLKRSLLTGMNDLMNRSMKVETLQAWDWYVRFLGCYSTKKRNLMNVMLKIPQQTFTDHNPQVQIVSQVAWEGLVDALINTPLLTCESSRASEKDTQLVQKISTLRSSFQILASGLLKSIKLIMTPLMGIILSKCDTSVHSACLNTWLYLLHKLDVCVNHPSVIELVLAPFLEAVFQMGLDTTTICLWTTCLELLNDFVLVQVPTSGEYAWKQQPIKWQPWNIDKLDFFLKVVSILMSHESAALEYRKSARDGATRIFKSIAKRVQLEFNTSSISFTDIMYFWNAMLCFVKASSESVVSKVGNSDELSPVCLQFVEVLIEEIQPTALRSPLYKVALDLAYLQNLPTPLNEMRDYYNLLETSSISYMEKVTPLIYLITVFMCTVIRSTSREDETKLALLRVEKFFKMVWRSSESLQDIYVPFCLLHKHGAYGRLGQQLWFSVAIGFKDCIDSRQISPFVTEDDNQEVGYRVLCHFLLYPFVSHCHPKATLEVVSGFSSQQHITEVWKSLYLTLCTSQCSTIKGSRLSEELCSMLNIFIDQRCGTKVDLSNEVPHFHLVSLCGNAVICISQHIIDGDWSKSVRDHGTSYGISNRLGFAARFLKLSWKLVEQSQLDDLSLVSRAISALADAAASLHSKQNVLLFMEMISCPMLQWLSHERLPDESIMDQLSRLWGEILSSLQRSLPPISFDSSFLKLQAPVLQKTLDHPVSSISKLTISFWNSTYGGDMKLDYPESLLDLLDRLSRSNRIHLGKIPHPFLSRCEPRPPMPLGRYNIVATNNRNSKRVEIVEFRSSSKRKKLELTEHQKEVRRAQQGREMDCNGHGPGIRTYTTVDFSQENEDSQESQELRNTESILELLRKT
ncbi:unnamed protein product [Linum tenue]|uniref:Telomere-associated protein Rif1 N-terminal domain-containing protein n=1 Tax=Linum tenue TaxID=586396 RepID=A0AAV0MEV3_9ROSI|nr:unnamed protein product [Linum tenue]